MVNQVNRSNNEILDNLQSSSDKKSSFADMGTSYDLGSSGNSVASSDDSANNAKSKARELAKQLMAKRDQGRASIKSERGFQKNLDQAAHLLSKEVEDIILNKCAPDGAAAFDESGHFNSSLGHKGIAPDSTSHTEAPVNGNAHSSFSFPAELERSDEIDQVEIDEATSEAGRSFDADLYEVRFDAYDNHLVAATKDKKGTRYRVALDVRSTPQKRMSESTQYMLDFHNRPRDMNKRVEENGVDQDAWYIAFNAIFDDLRKAKGVTYTVKPLKATLKKIVRDGNKRTSAFVPYAAAILYEVSGEEPTIIFMWGSWQTQVVLDETFNRKSQTALWKKGRHLDKSRLSEDVDRQQKKSIKIITNVNDI